ncbi:thiamine phosphate synthase [Plebeiibacterium marinum]|uniref:Thiamine-phosphate synthase n=1 Tax=Plebeiibacterium marinum TaxID=2992111 RepID=A0AAE3MG21_9BACT|nr:thiamine phosphate synthase [Plebeiobacterium marinum]MCW3807193.1 thiamine phosphate synthase [Plebeiobacterium marinum]
MNKYIGRLHFVTFQNTEIPIEQQVQEYCAGGGNWVQLRLKNKTEEEIISIALKCQRICMEHNATFIINDYVDIAKKIDADGVHLGLNDCSVSEARKQLGEHKIIGATANTFEHIQQHVSEGVDYIGLGPFRFTQTKENLSPVLDFKGYMDIVSKCYTNKTDIPIIAIGGITTEDIMPLYNTGIYGIALSSYIAKSKNIGLTTIDILSEIGKGQSVNFTKKKK